MKELCLTAILLTGCVVSSAETVEANGTVTEWYCNRNGVGNVYQLILEDAEINSKPYSSLTVNHWRGPADCIVEDVEKGTKVKIVGEYDNLSRIFWSDKTYLSPDNRTWPE